MNKGAILKLPIVKKQSRGPAAAGSGFESIFEEPIKKERVFFIERVFSNAFLSLGNKTLPGIKSRARNSHH